NRVDPVCAQDEQRYGEEDRGNRDAGAHVTADAARPAQASGPGVQWWPEADRRLECLAAVAEEVIAGITETIFLHAGMRTRWVLRRQDGSTGDVEFRAVRPTRQFLDGAAVEIA